MKKDERFEYMPLSWYKRRTPTETPPQIIGYNVLNFEKVENHWCTIEAWFDDGSYHALNARVTANTIHTIGGPDKITHWSVQGTNPHGLSVCLKYIETK